MIPTEDNYIDWILSGIKDYFRKIGYRVRTYSIGQVKEHQCPIDRILAVENKIVGIQFKRPLGNKPPWKYNIEHNQYQNISKARWIFYCLPDFTELNLQEVALFHCKFQPGREFLKSNVQQQRYYRWGAFASALIRCQEGLIIDKEHIDKLITDMYENPKDVYLSLNKKAEEVYIVRDVPPDVEMDYEPA
jgi:hypothetical protein